jgi:hypothetical protein
MLSPGVTSLAIGIGNLFTGVLSQSDITLKKPLNILKHI